MRTSSRSSHTALAIAAALCALLRLDNTAPNTSIGAAQAAVRSGSEAARATEAIRYDDTTLELLGAYTTQNSELATAIDTRDLTLWNLVRTTLPDDAVASIRQLNVVTDGRDGTLAMVHRSTLDPNTWVLSIDFAETKDVLVSTLVHEYAHMLTLRPGDLEGRASSRQGCKGVKIEIGCAREGSALAEWHDTFWSDLAEPASANAGVFVSGYAASSVHEDLAETFMAWTLDEVERPSAGVRARFAFFEARPEFVTARDAVRTKLGR